MAEGDGIRPTSVADRPMPAQLHADPDHRRWRAEDMRTLAEEMEDLLTKAIMLLI